MLTAQQTAGEPVALRCGLPWVGALLEGCLAPAEPAPARVTVVVEPDRAPFPTAGCEPLTRGAWRAPDGRLVLHNVASAGFDLQVWYAEQLTLRARWRPPAPSRAAGLVLRPRFRLLVRQVLVHYPALWSAGLRGRVPLHASVCAVPGTTALVAGPGGVGKSTLLAAELAAGGVASSDNVCVADGRTAYGLVEPLRVAGGSGRRSSHGRREYPLPNRVPALDPDCLVVLRRDGSRVSRTEPVPAEVAAGVLTAGTYMAGELRRYWGFAATLALGTGRGPAHPPVGAVAAALAARLPCRQVVLGTDRGPALRKLRQEAVTG